MSAAPYEQEVGQQGSVRREFKKVLRFQEDIARCALTLKREEDALEAEDCPETDLLGQIQLPIFRGIHEFPAFTQIVRNSFLAGQSLRANTPKRLRM